MSEEQARIIRLCEEAGDFVTGLDGFVVFWPKGTRGGFTAEQLRTIADVIDKRNKLWADVVNRYFDEVEHD